MVPLLPQILCTANTYFCQYSTWYHFCYGFYVQPPLTLAKVHGQAPVQSVGSVVDVLILISQAVVAAVLHVAVVRDTVQGLLVLEGGNNNMQGPVNERSFSFMLLKLNLCL